MRIHVVVHVLSLLLTAIGLSMIAPLAVAIWYGGDDVFPFLFSIMLTVGAGLLVWSLTRSRLTDLSRVELRRREGYAITALGWVLMCAFGALPYMLADTFITPELAATLSPAGRLSRSIADSLFETVSGFTTTGSSVLVDYEQPRGIMFWRSMTHWIGGMGIILTSIAILPFLGVGGMQLFKAEVPGPTKDRLSPRIADTAKLLWTVYLALTSAQIALLWLPGAMSLYDAVCHAFGTVSTGGFSNYGSSLVDASPYTQYVVTVFMFLSGVNFALHYRYLAQRRPLAGVSEYVNDAEFRQYALLLMVATLIVLAARAPYNLLSWEPLFRQSLFMVVSIGTETGFAAADYNTWPHVAQYVMMLLMFVGGCAGSTSGGIKQLRFLVAVKSTAREIRRTAQPNQALTLMMGGKIVADTVVAAMLIYIMTHSLIVIGVTLLLGLGGHDTATAFSASLATISGCGPGLHRVGPVDNFAFFADWQKLLLCGNMLLGRLEIYVLLALFTRRLWK